MNILERDPKGTCMYASVLDLESLQNCFGSKRTLILIVFPPSLDFGGRHVALAVCRYPPL